MWFGHIDIVQRAQPDGVRCPTKKTFPRSAVRSVTFATAGARHQRVFCTSSTNDGTAR